jgi:hypothetical protein
LYLVFTEEISLNPNLYRVFFSKSTNGGISWTSPVQIGNTTSNVSMAGASVISDGPGSIYLAWQDNSANPGQYPGGNHIYFARSTDGGITWTAAVQIDDGTTTTAAGLLRYPSATHVRNGGHVMVVWTDNRLGRYDVYFAESFNYGQTWMSDIRVNSVTTGQNSNYGFWVNAVGEVFVSWTNAQSGSSDTPGNDRLYVSRALR